MRVAGLEHTVQPAQEVAVGSRDLGVAERVEDRLVVLVDQYDDALATALVQLLDDVPQPIVGGVVPSGYTECPFNAVEQGLGDAFETLGSSEVAGEVQPHHRVSRAEVPAPMDGEPLEQFFRALEQFLDMVGRYDLISG